MLDRQCMAMATRAPYWFARVPKWQSTEYYSIVWTGPLLNVDLASNYYYSNLFLSGIVLIA